MKSDVDKSKPFFDLNFEFPRPREQQIHGLADNDILFSTDGFGCDEFGMQKDVVGFPIAAPNVYVKLIRAVLKGKHDKELIKLTDACGGVDVLLNLRLRIKDDARLKVKIRKRQYLNFKNI